MYKNTQIYRDPSDQGMKEENGRNRKGKEKNERRRRDEGKGEEGKKEERQGGCTGSRLRRKCN